MIQLSNPRLEATIDDWPIGRNKRGTAVFRVESSMTKGERVARRISGKAKRTTYCLKMRIVDGDDGRTYLCGSTEYGQHVMLYGTLKECGYFYADSTGDGAESKLAMYNQIGEMLR